MIDWLTVLLALGIIATLVGIFGFMAWKINMPDPLVSANSTGKKDDGNQLFDGEKRKKDKSGNDQSKKKRKEQKKSKRENKDDEQEEHIVKFKEPTAQTSEETDNEQEESEQESITPPVVESSSKVRNRNKKKARPTTPPPSPGRLEGILANKNEKSPVTSRAQPIPHPKIAAAPPKDEVELARQHQAQAKTQAKPTQGPNKQTVPAASAPVPVKKSASASSNANQGGQKQQQQSLLEEQQEQPFTTVGGNRHKAGTPPSQQQNKPANATTTVAAAAVAAPAPLTQTQQQQAPPPPPPTAPVVQAQHQQLPQRHGQPRQQKEAPTQVNGFNANSQPVKQPVAVNNPSPPARLADLIKALPSSQVVVTELMSALDASSLSTDELDIIMHKIANKQSVLKQDWSKLQHGQKVDPQAHIGQVLDESARAYEEDMKTNAIKRIKDLTDELNNEKRRVNDLSKEINEKDRSIQVLHAQLTTIQHPQQQMQSFQVELQRLSEENLQLKQRLAQQQQHIQQQQQFSSLNLTNSNGGDAGNTQMRVLSEQIKKLSVDNGNLEKQLKAKDATVKESQKDREDLVRSNQQLVQKVQESQKQFQLNEEKFLKELNETRTLNLNQLNEYKRRVEQLESEKEQLRRMEVTVASNNEEREKLERVTQENEQYKSKLKDAQNQLQNRENQLQQEIDQYKSKLNDVQNQFQTRENQLKQEFEQLKSKSEDNNNSNEKLAATNAQLDALRAELAEAKANNDSNKTQLEQEKYKEVLLQLLDQDARNQLPKDSQDFNQWFSSYRQILTSNIESNKRILQDQSITLKRENDQLHQNMNEIEKQLRGIEQTVQSKEEELLTELKTKDTMMGNIIGENERLRDEITRLQSAHDTTVKENRALKVQLNEQHLVDVHSPSTTADDSYEFVNQQSPPPAKIDPRAEVLNQLIRSTKEALENQDSFVQQLDKHIDKMHHSGAGEIANVDDPTVSSTSSSFDQTQTQS